MQLAHNLFRSVKRDDKDQVMHLLNQAGPACNVLLQRDGAGNTCLHYAQSVEMMKLLSERQPGAEKLLNEKGQPDTRWFIEDELHLNAAGYAMWTEQIKPLVKRLLEESRRGRATKSTTRSL